MGNSHLQRATGRIILNVVSKSGQTICDNIHQSGAARVRFPLGLDHTPEAVLINTSGGMTDGDQFTVNVNVKEDAQIRVTSQANEKIYRSRGDYSIIDTKIEVANKAKLHWLPQETIIFNGGRLRRKADIDLHKGSELIAVEAIILGRSAMNETVLKGEIQEEWCVKLDNKLHFIDRTHLGPNIHSTFKALSIGQGFGALATILIFGENSTIWVRKLKELEGGDDAFIGVSELGQLSLLRVLSRDGASLRETLLSVLNIINPQIIPRVWAC